MKTCLLKDLVNFKTGDIIKNLSILKQAGSLNEGQYEIISSATKQVGRWDRFNREAKMITITKDGINAGYIAWQDQPFWATEHSLTLINKNEDVINSKYLYHFLKSMQADIHNNKIDSAIPYVTVEYLSKIAIPLPPLATQQAIASTLDQFVQLKDQLNQELSLRQKQYQYYLKTLLDFENPEHPFVKNGGGN